jgi:large subunit ribosomal protein L21
MYAIVESRGRQYKVSPGDVVALDILNIPSGEAYNFDKVLALVDENQNTILNQDELDKVKVSGIVTGDKKGEKLIAFKYKKHKDYHRKKGHRQGYTLVRVENIG